MLERTVPESFSTHTGPEINEELQTVDMLGLVDECGGGGCH